MKNLELLRRVRGYSQYQLAELTGCVNQADVSHAELGRYPLNKDKCEALAMALRYTGDPTNLNEDVNEEVVILATM